MDFTTMDPAMQWTIGNIILFWFCNICVMVYVCNNEPIMNTMSSRIERLELQNKVICQALEKLNSRLTIPVRRDEILGLRFEIATLTADLQKHKTKTLNRRRIIESSDDEE